MKLHFGIEVFTDTTHATQNTHIQSNKWTNQYCAHLEDHAREKVGVIVVVCFCIVGYLLDLFIRIKLY